MRSTITMPPRAKTVAAVAAITAVAVVGLDAGTYASTGDSLIIGTFNKSGKTTQLKSTGKGPALSLHARGKRPALKVDSRARVRKLNADRLDGKNAKQLRNNVRVYRATSGDSTNGVLEFKLSDFPNGRYQVSYGVTIVGANGSRTDPTQADCLLYSPGPNGSVGKVSGYVTTTSMGYQVGLSASGIVDKGAAGWRLNCAAFQTGAGPDDWSIDSARPIRIMLTRIDKTVRGRLKPARTAPDARIPRDLRR